jgi:hypothetical protein
MDQRLFYLGKTLELLKIRGGISVLNPLRFWNLEQQTHVGAIFQQAKS